MIRRPPRSTLFPYTALIRSHHQRPRVGQQVRQRVVRPEIAVDDRRDEVEVEQRPPQRGGRLRGRRGALHHGEGVRSEAHTSELQSRQYLVCRLLLEKNTTLHLFARPPLPPATQTEPSACCRPSASPLLRTR